MKTMKYSNFFHLLWPSWFHCHFWCSLLYLDYSTVYSKVVIKQAWYMCLTKFLCSNQLHIVFCLIITCLTKLFWTLTVYWVKCVGLTTFLGAYIYDFFILQKIVHNYLNLSISLRHSVKSTNGNIYQYKISLSIYIWNWNT